MGAGTVTATAAGVPGKARARGPSRQRGPAPWAKTSRRPCRGTRSRGCSGAARGARGRGSSELAFLNFFLFLFERARGTFFSLLPLAHSLFYPSLSLFILSLSLSQNPSAATPRSSPRPSTPRSSAGAPPERPTPRSGPRREEASPFLPLRRGTRPPPPLSRSTRSTPTSTPSRRSSRRWTPRAPRCRLFRFRTT